MSSCIDGGVREEGAVKSDEVAEVPVPLWLSKARQMREDGVVRYSTCVIVVVALCTSPCVQGGKRWWQEM